jgi:DNA-binding winged helix-turn-helix (wHTH) protein
MDRAKVFGLGLSGSERSASMADNGLSFGRFRLDLSGRRVLFGERALPLGDRAFQVLRVLASAKGAAVSKDELLDQVWAGVTVEENNLQVQISTLRKALDPEGTGDSWIVTVPGRGYRLLGVEDTLHPQSPANPPPADHQSLLPQLAQTTSREPLAPVVAVLPFANFSHEPRWDRLCDGLVEDIITSLARHRDLLVIARQSSFAYRGQHIDIRNIGRELGARYLPCTSRGRAAEGNGTAHQWRVRPPCLGRQLYP